MLNSYMLKKHMSMIRKYHNHTLQTNPRHREEAPHKNQKTPGRQTKQKNQLSFPIKMFAKLEKTQSNSEKKWIKHKTPQRKQQSTANQQQQYNHRLRTDSSLSQQVCGWVGVNKFYWYQMFALVKTQQYNNLHGDFLTIAMHSLRETA